jgi:hypothetical protein
MNVSYEMLETIYQITRRHIPGDRNLILYFFYYWWGGTESVGICSSP